MSARRALPFVLAGCVVALGGGAVRAPAQSAAGYTLQRNAVVAGGGGMSGATYALTGTVAQPVAQSTCARGASGYALRSGFWSGPRAADLIFLDGFESAC